MEFWHLVDTSKSMERSNGGLATQRAIATLRSAFPEAQHTVLGLEDEEDGYCSLLALDPVLSASYNSDCGRSWWEWPKAVAGSPAIFVIYTDEDSISTDFEPVLEFLLGRGPLNALIDPRYGKSEEVYGDLAIASGGAWFDLLNLDLEALVAVKTAEVARFAAAAPVPVPVPAVPAVTEPNAHLVLFIVLASLKLIKKFW